MENSGLFPKVLVGCPTYSGFGYCLDRFLARVKSLSYKNYDVLIADKICMTMNLAKRFVKGA